MISYKLNTWPWRRSTFIQWAKSWNRKNAENQISFIKNYAFLGDRKNTPVFSHCSYILNMLKIDSNTTKYKWELRKDDSWEGTEHTISDQFWFLLLESYRINMKTLFGSSHDDFTYIILLFTEFGWELKVLFHSEPFFYLLIQLYSSFWWHITFDMLCLQVLQSFIIPFIDTVKHSFSYALHLRIFTD